MENQVFKPNVGPPQAQPISESVVEVKEKFQESFPNLLGRHRKEVEDSLGKALVVGNHELQTMLGYHLGWTDEHGHRTHDNQGKGLRSSLCMFACESVGGAPVDALSAAVAIELVHNFSLIHDDIQDGDKERRHRPTLWAIWGMPRALQAGNVMRILADLGIQQLQHHRASPEVLAESSNLLTVAYLEMVEGQYLDLDFEGRTDISTADYLDMISRKTGALLRCAMQLGALAGNGEARAVQALAECGQYLGTVFQIRDGYLGIWGYEEETGKSAGNDLRRKKNSLPLVYALEQVASIQKEQLQLIYAKEEIDDRDVSLMLALLEDLGVSEYVERLAQVYADRALAAIEGIELIAGAREEIEGLVKFLITRSR